MKKIKFIQIVIFALLFCSCEKAHESYFDEGASEEIFEGGDQLLYDYLVKQPIYSKFTSLLKETEVDKILEANHLLTVWAIPDSLFPDEVLGQVLSQKVRFIKNHINSIALVQSHLEKDRSILTLASKMLIFDYQDSVSMLDGVQVRRMNQLCKNGVVHEVAGVLTPRQNVYEYIVESGDKYSTFRDTIMAYNDTVFIPEWSIPSGVDEVGNTIYSDSVFIMVNPYLPLELIDDSERMTYLLPSNDAVQSLMLNITTFFKQIEREFTQEDTVAVMEWLMKGVIHDGEITNYGEKKERDSFYDINWRTDKQIVNLNYTKCSNGIVYELTAILYPKYNYMERIFIRPYLYFTDQVSEEDKKKFMSHSTGVTPSHTNPDGQDLVNIWTGSGSASAAQYIEFSSVTRDIYGSVEHVKVLPGTYKFAGSHRTYQCKKQQIDVVVDGELESVGEFDINKSSGYFYEYIPEKDVAKKDVKNNGLYLDEFVVKEEWGYDYLRFRVTNSGKSTRMTIQYFYLEPTEDNY